VDMAFVLGNKAADDDDSDEGEVVHEASNTSSHSPPIWVIEENHHNLKNKLEGIRFNSPKHMLRGDFRMHGCLLPPILQEYICVLPFGYIFL
jgi:hypothetical protein